jgi:hypothetical protein
MSDILDDLITRRETLALGHIKNDLDNEAIAEIARLNTRVEELERENLRILKTANMQSQWIQETEDKRRITEERIDEAWDLTYNEAANHMISTGVKQALSKFGIVACERCGGSGKTESRTGSMKEEPMLWLCKDCYRNGRSHGWLWKEVVDDVE